MDSILERITLYDILGYFVPGSLVMLAVCGMFLSSSDQRGAALYQNYEKLFVYGFILTSYICGILLSETGRKILDRWAGDTEFSVPDESIKRALEKSGAVTFRNEEKINTTDYFRQMYNDIQSDSAYKRLHNYASAEVLYKNLSLAMLISAGILCCYFPKCFWGKGVVLAAGIAGMKIAWGRARRFSRKKRDYTVCCYVGKYLGVK